MKPFNLEAALAGAKVVTRDGEEVTKITDFDTDETYPVRGVLSGVVISFTKNGKYTCDEGSHRYDLFMAPTKHEGWIGIRKAADGSSCTYYSSHIYSSQEKACQGCGPSHSVVRIEWED